MPKKKSNKKAAARVILEESRFYRDDEEYQGGMSSCKWSPLTKPFDVILSFPRRRESSSFLNTIFHIKMMG